MDRIKKLCTRYNIIFISIMALFLIWGFFAFRDYGISWDEEVQRNRGLAGLKSAIELTMGEEAVPQALQKEEIIKRQPGSLGIKLPVVLAEYALGFRLTNGAVFKMYHLYNFLLFFISAFFAYYLFISLGFKEIYALLGLVLYIISPRILADAFYNNKDLVFLSLYTMILALLVSLMKKFRWSTLLLLSLITVLGFGVRTIAPFPVLIFGLYYIVKETDFKDIKTIRKPLLRLLAGVACCLILYLLLTPKAWYDFGGSLASKMGDVTSFTHGGFDLIAGKIYNRLELPWYYLPFTIILTVPCFYLVYSALGTILLAYKGLSAGKISEENIYLLLLLGQALVFYIYCMALKPMQYNYWRHFYFLHVYMVIFVIYAVRWAVEKSRALKGMTVIFAVGSICLTVMWIAKNHPYEYMYFNPVFRDGAAQESDNDYWKVTYQELLSKISDGSNADVYLFPTLTGNQLFGESGFENFHQEALEHSAKYRIVEGNPGDNPFYIGLKNVIVDDRIVQTVIGRVNYANVIRKYFLDSGEVKGINYGKEIEWSVKKEGIKEILIAHIPAGVCVKEIDLLYGDAYGRPVVYTDEEEYTAAKSAVADMAAYVSQDGNEYLRVKDELVFSENDIYGISSGEEYFPEYVMFSYEKTSDNVNMAVRVYGDEDKNKLDAVYYRYEAAQLIDSIRISNESADVSLLTDGRENTVCIISDSMKGDEYIDITLKEPMALQGLHIDGGAYPLNEGRYIVIEGRNKNGEYTELPYYYAGADDYLFEAADVYDGYRILQKGQSDEAFAVSEIGLLK